MPDNTHSPGGARQSRAGGTLDFRALALIKGRRATGFSNEEETLVGLADVVPYLTETELVKRGAHYQKADKPWAPFAIADGRLITGQNPASGGPVADLVLAAIK